MRQIFIICLFLASFNLIADDELEEGLDVSATEGLPSSLVQGVCVISGEYTLSQTDLSLSGPQSLIFQRHYSSRMPGGRFGKGWAVNHGERMQVVKISNDSKNNHPYWQLSLLQSGGTQLIYQHEKRCKEENFFKDYRNLVFNWKMPKGLTNGAHIMSGRNNLNNYEMVYESKGDRFRLTTGAGNHKIFEYKQTKKKMSDDDVFHYLLKYDKKPNGSYYEYQYKEGHLSHIDCKSLVTKKLFNQICIERTKEKEKVFKKLIASDGRFVDYQFKYKKYKNDHQDHPAYLCLTDVSSPFVISEHYSYAEVGANFSPQIIKIKRPAGRFQKIDYYHHQTNIITGKLDVHHLKDPLLINDPLKFAHIKEKKDYRIGRVKSLQSPVGTGSEPIITHYFIYQCRVLHPGKENEKLRKGTTTVLDAYHHPTTYDYDNYHRLTQVTRFSDKKSPYATENFIWDDKRGYLKGKILADAGGVIQYGKFYKYDSRGNVLKSTLYGSLTGLPCSSLTLDENQKPLKGTEKEEKIYTYTDDGFNLLCTEKESNGVKTHYRYVPNRDLVQAKWTTDDEGIFLRQFYDYTPEGVLSCQVTDDGKALELNDLSFVTERRITRYSATQGTPYGLPECIAESYLEMATGQEKPLKTTYCLYSTAGQLIRQDIHDATGILAYSLFWDYNEKGQVVREVNALGEVTKRTYDDNKLLVREELPHGTVTTNTYDFANRLINQVENHSNGQVLSTSYTYNYLNQCIKTIDSYGNEKNQTFDPLGRLVESSCAVVYDEKHQAVKPVIKMNYNSLNQLVSLCDAKGRQTFYQYNVRNQTTHILYPDQTTERFIYRIDGQLSEKIEKNGNHLYYLRDQRGRLTGEHVYDAAGKFLKGENHTYNSLHRLTSTDAEGILTAYHYDGAGRLEWVIKGEQKQQNFYDTLGRLSETREWFDKGPLDYIRYLKAYDFLNRLTEERTETAFNEIVHLTKTSYDAQGNKTLVQIGEQITKTEYDSQARVTKITNALGEATHLFYQADFVNDLSQRVLKVTTTDPLGYQTIQTYDAAQRVVEVERKNPFGKRASYQKTLYDLCGNPTTLYDHVIEEENLLIIETAYVYDAAHRVVSLFEAKGTAEQKVTSYRYNEEGKKTALIKPDGVQIFYQYDPLGRLIRMQACNGSIDYTYAYNLKDDLILATDEITHQTTLCSYTQEGYLDCETLGHGLTMRYSYDLAGHLKKIILPDDSSIEYDYQGLDLKAVRRFQKDKSYIHQNLSHNLARQVTKAKLPHGEEVTYCYDVLGRCIQLNSFHFMQEIPKDGFDAAGHLKTLVTQKEEAFFVYDDLDQLIHEPGQSYRFNSLGNRLNKNEEVYTYNSLNQLKQGGQKIFNHDLNGNMSSYIEKGQETIYTFDVLDRLTSVTQKNQTTTYTYDPLNRRLTKEGKDLHYFLYLDKHEIGTWANEAIQELCILGEESSHPLVAIELQGVFYTPLHDLTGNISTLLDEQGEVVESYRYTAYGETEIYNSQGERQTSSSVNNPWQYASKRLDPESGLIAFGLRYYAPPLGRWISADPIGFADGPNLYAYLHNSPLTSFDQFGLFEWSWSNIFFREPEVTLISPEKYFVTEMTRDEFIERNMAENGVSGGFWRPKGSTLNNLNDLNLINPKTQSPFNLTTVPGKFHGFNNGIMNQEIDFKNSMMNIAMLSGHNLDGIHSMTFGFGYDSLMYLAGCNYTANDPVKHILNFWDSCFENHPNPQILQECHIKGAVDVRNALLLTSPEKRQHIQVLAVAPGIIIDRYLCAKVTHLVSIGDVIPFLDLTGMIKNFSTIKFLMPINNAFPMDHSFTNETYKKPRQNFYKNFYQE